MLRLVCNAARNGITTAIRNGIVNKISKIDSNLSIPRVSFSTLNYMNEAPIKSYNPTRSILLNPKINILASQIIPSRTVTKFSLKSGKRKTVKTVLQRFYRLNWGGWIRTRAGRHKKLWKKSPNLKRKLKQHVFCNGTQSWLLDSMVTSFWRKPKYYVDDPYEPYHTREEYHMTRKKPIVRD